MENTMTAQTGKYPVTLSIGKGVHCYDLPGSAKDKIRNDLTIDNPKYVKAKKMGRWGTGTLSAKLYWFAEEDGDFWIPRGYLYYLKQWLNKNNYPVFIEDRTLLLPKIDIEFQGKLRDYQQPAVDDLVMRYPVGVLEASTGAGKTVMGTGIIARRKQPTLIIVHNKELLYQWQEAIKKFLAYDCGLVGDSKYDVKDITVGIINSVKNKVPELSKQFGQVIVDECHRCPSATWTKAVSEFPARHYLGLSATPYRSDGLGYAITAYIGPKLHVVNKKKLNKIGAVLVPTIKRIETRFRYFYKDDYSKMISKLCKDTARNKLIASSICNDFKQNRENVLVVSDRVTHCKEIAIQLEKMNRPALLLSGKDVGRMRSKMSYDEDGKKSRVWFVDKMKRTEVVEHVKAGKVNVLIATLSLVGEGFDAPNLTALFITTPVKFSGRLLQVIGRVLRPAKGKKPRVYDFRDNGVSVLQYSGYNRDKIYRKQWG